MPPKRMLFVDESEEEGDYIEVSERRIDVEEEEKELVEVDLDDDDEEEEEEEEDKDLQEKENDDLEGEEEEDQDLEEKEDDLEEEKEEIEEEDKDLEEKEDDDLEEEDDEDLQEEEEDQDLQEKEGDLEEEEDKNPNAYYFGKKSPTHFDNDQIKNHDSYPSFSNPNENHVNNKTTTIKRKMPTEKPTILSKRAAENRNFLDVTRSKIRKVLDGSKREDRFGKKESGKKFAGTCSRLWSEDDEIILLKGMIDYHSEKGVDPYADMGTFHKFILTLLHVDVSRDQLIRKIRRLKKKYQNHKMEDGKDPVFPRLHEQKSFKLSKKIWGGEDDDDDDVDDHEEVEKGEATKAEDKTGQEKFWSLYPCLSESLHLEQFSKYSLPDYGMSFVKERLSSIGSTKAKEFEDKWRQLHVAETGVNMQRAQLILEQTELILNAIK